MFPINDNTKKSVFISENFNHNFRSLNLIDEACEQFTACTNPNKINLTIGVCGDESKKPYSFKLVKAVEESILNDDSVTRGYLDHDGMKKFNNSILKYFLSDHIEEIENGMVQINICDIVGAYFLALYKDLIDETGGLEMKFYPYYDKKHDILIFDQLLSYIKNCQQKSVFIFNTCAHNPTGTDIPPQQWEMLTDAIIEKNIILIMDSVFLGFISGDPWEDFSPVRTLLQKGVEFFATVSFSKNLGLYCNISMKLKLAERVGCLLYRTNSRQTTEIICKRIFDLVAGGYMSPPKRGAEIVSLILSDVHLISAILNQKGIFVFFDLSIEQIEYLRSRHFVFMIKNGRANISSLNGHEISRLARGIHDCLTRN
ncbi:hypothetical protein MXB_4137 [Myxobolus squamalis]|nr:hypothetical protein MXB_4137 [Myxobolus squamalis]